MNQLPEYIIRYVWKQFPDNFNGIRLENLIIHSDNCFLVHNPSPVNCTNINCNNLGKWFCKIDLGFYCDDCIEGHLKGYIK